jgi:cobalt-zinc-cadmium efflux system outer membrane protein
MFRSLIFPHFLFFITIAAIIYPAHSARSEAVTLTLDESVSYALAHNKNLAAARLRIEEARGQVLGSGRLQNPEMELEFRRNSQTSEHGVHGRIMQRLPLTGRLPLEKAVAKAQLSAAEAEVRDFQRRLAADVRASSIKLLALKAKRIVTQGQLANSREQGKFTATRVEKGEASSLDVYQMEVETGQIELEIRQIDMESATRTEDLRVLLGIDPGANLQISGSLETVTVAGEKDTFATNGSARPDLEAARFTERSAQKATELAKARKWEDIALGLSASRERTEDAPEGLSNDDFLGLHLSVPLPIWNRNEGGIAQAKAFALRAEKEAGALAANIRNEIDTARREMAALRTLIAEMDSSLLPKATALEEALFKSYEAGQSPLTEVLRARSHRLDLVGRRIDALKDYHLAKSRYQAAIGSPSASKF